MSTKCSFADMISGKLRMRRETLLLPVLIFRKNSRSMFAFVLTLAIGLISSPPSRSGEGRVAIVFDTWQRDADGRYDAGP